MTKIDPKLLAAIVAAVVQTLDAKAQKPAKSLAKSMKIDPKSNMSTKEQRKLQLELLTKEVFEAKGFKEVVPRKNVLTASGWAAQGKTVLNGQEPIWVKAPWMSAKQMGYPMFHITQVA